MKTDNYFPCTLIYFCQSIIPRDPGITDSSILDPGIEKNDPGLQSLVLVSAAPGRRHLRSADTDTACSGQFHLCAS